MWKIVYPLALIFTCNVHSAIVSIIGSEETPHPLIEKLLEHPAMQRMKEIDQSGIAKYYLGLPSFRRFDHCVGVYMLLRRFHAPLDVCVAGLLHDVSHTVFSHVADYLFRGADLDHSYQDQIHLWYLEQCAIEGKLSPYHLSLKDIDPDQFHILEKPLPELCADRIEYNLHTGYLWEILTQAEIEEILKDLQYQEGTWFFQTQQIARKFAELPLHFNMTLWGDVNNLIVYHWTSLALKRALEIDEVTSEEIHFSTDRIVLQKLLISEDMQIRDFMHRCFCFADCYEKTSPEKADLYIPIKFRGIDPWVQTSEGLMRLTALDMEFAKKWEEVKTFADQGHHLKIRPMNRLK